MAGMQPFHEWCPEIACDEYRSIHLMNDPELPDGEYGFVELYCTEKGCDCRRVVFWVVATHLPEPHVATLNFGWESAEFYASC